MIQKTFDFSDPVAIHKELKRQAELMMPSFGHGPSPVLDSLLLAMASTMAAQNDAMEKMIEHLTAEMYKKFDVNDIFLDKDGNAVIQRTIKLPDTIEFAPVSINIDGVKALCYHQWVEYVGMHEVFNHCKKCGEKQS